MNSEGPASSPSEAVVRDATEADVPALEACYARARHLERIRGANATRRYLLVEVDGVVAGFGRLMLADSNEGRMARYVPRIINLNVREDMQGRGLGTLLIRTMEGLAQSAGHRRIFIGASRLNLRARQLYQRMGYVPIAEPPTGSGRPRPARPRREPGPRWRRWRRKLRWLRWLRRRRRREPAIYMNKVLPSAGSSGSAEI